jgi:gliding motility-associated-like protein
LPEESCRETLQIPSGFTPNNDGFNDVFLIRGLDDYPDNAFVVYNRWGNKVFEQSPYKNKWKGVNKSNELLPEGTYFYILTVKTIDQVFKGYVDIRR